MKIQKNQIKIKKRNWCALLEVLERLFFNELDLLEVIS
jgi:hypothetical protein